MIGTALDGDGHGGVVHITVGVFYLVGKGFRQFLAVVQRIDSSVGVIQHIAVSTVGIGRKGTVLRCGVALPAIKGYRAVEGAVVDQGVAADAVGSTVFGQGVRFILRHWVGVGDQHIQTVIGSDAVIVGDGKRKAVHHALIACSVILRTVDGIAVIQLAGCLVVTGELQGAFGCGDRQRAGGSKCL